MTKISAQKLPLKEIEEELEWLIDEFESHMSLHKLKENTETLETLVKAPIELIENLVSLKPSKILDPIFSVQKTRISLIESEITAPGKEIAYIIKTNETFTSEA